MLGFQQGCSHWWLGNLWLSPGQWSRFLVDNLIETLVQQWGNLGTWLWKNAKSCNEAPFWPFCQVRVDNRLQLMHKEKVIWHWQCFFMQILVELKLPWMRNVKNQKLNVKTTKNYNWNKSFAKKLWKRFQLFISMSAQSIEKLLQKWFKNCLEIGIGKIAWKSLPKSIESCLLYTSDAADE